MLFHSQVVPMVLHTVTLPEFLNVPEVLFVFPPSCIRFVCLFFLSLLVSFNLSDFLLVPLLSPEIHRGNEYTQRLNI